MALPTVLLTGLAQFTGVAGTITYASAAIFPLQRNYKVRHNYEEQREKDPSGYDAFWAARNENYECDIGMFLVDSSGYTSTPSAGSVDNAIKGAFFPTPLTVITLSGFGGAHASDYPLLNTTWMIIPGSEIEMDNMKPGEMIWKLRRYTNAAQQALLQLTPTY